jgi:predicted component of type VI protein secretion system
MPHKAIRKLFVVMGLALFALVGVVLPIRIVRAAFVSGETRQAKEVLVTALPTITPADAITATQVSTPAQVLTPTLTLIPTEEVTFTDAVPATPSPSMSPLTPSPLPTEAQDMLVPTEMPTVGPPTGEAKPISTDIPGTTASPTVAPPAATELPFDVLTLLDENRMLLGVSCLVVFVFVVIVVLVLFALRREKPKPKAPVSPPPKQKQVLEAASGAYLETIDVGGSPLQFPLKPDGVSIGRGSQNDIVITQDMLGWRSVSHRHARVYRRGDWWIVEDLDSTNGVWVNGKRTGHNVLEDGWRVAVGGIEFVFHTGTGEAAQ